MKEYLRINRERIRMHKLRWYYKNRKMINMMYSKVISPEMDAFDKLYFETHPEG